MSIESTHLGKQSNYPQKYNPDVLVAVPRMINRVKYGLINHDLPFSGVDVWHAYEFSFLTIKGTPVVGLLKIVYTSSNEYLVESKSLKLYLNSFNMEHFGESQVKGINEVVAIVKKDLSDLLKCDVEVNYFNHNSTYGSNDFSDFKIIEEVIDIDKLSCVDYTENPDLLELSDSSGSIKWGTHLLRSNCKITHQPDWGSIFIEMNSKNIPTPESFLKYIVSLRNENHFHEEICEMVFKRLSDKYKPEKLSITCLYTRRGGIDINPVRSLISSDIPEFIKNPELLTVLTYRQ